MRCPECGEAMIQSTEPIEFEVHGETYYIEGIKHQRCQGCGEEIIRVNEIGELRQQANKRYKKAHNLLTGDEIKAIRTKLGVNQTELEHIIKSGEKTFTRWESNKVIQSGIADSLLRVLDAVPQAFSYLRGLRPHYSRAIMSHVELSAENRVLEAEASSIYKELTVA